MAELYQGNARNWIWQSIGAHVDFKVDGFEEGFTVFTTRCDTLFELIVSAPEHDLVEKITTPQQKAAVDAYVKLCANKIRIRAYRIE